MIGINLIPEVVQHDQTKRRHVRRWVSSVCAAAVLLAIPLTIDRVKRAEAFELASKRVKLERELVAVQTDVASLSAQVHETRQRLERAIALRAKRPWSAMFTMIEQRLPDLCWLVSVATDPPTPRGGPARSGVPPHRREEAGAAENQEQEDEPEVVVIETPRKLVVSGYALDAAAPYALVESLKQAGVFQSVELVQVRGEPVGNHPCFRFDLVCEW
jgi:Tfp pilus assembly protein PilN